MPVLAVLVLLISACGDGSNDEDNPVTSGTTGEGDIVSHMNLAANDSSWLFDSDDGESCPIDLILTSPVDVQARENAGDVVAVNEAGSAGVVLPADVSASCHDAAINLLADF